MVIKEYVWAGKMKREPLPIKRRLVKRDSRFQNNLKVNVGLNLRLKFLFLTQSPPPQRIQGSPS